MPIFEYLCKSCGKTFEKLAPRVTDESSPCPECGSEETQKKLSTFSSPHTCPSESICESMGKPCGKCNMH